MSACEFLKIGALKIVPRVVYYFLFDLGEIRNKRAAHFAGEYSFLENRPREGCFYGRQCKYSYIDACALKPHVILNAKKASGKTMYCVIEYAICGLVFFIFFLKRLIGIILKYSVIVTVSSS